MSQPEVMHDLMPLGALIDRPGMQSDNNENSMSSLHLCGGGGVIPPGESGSLNLPQVSEERENDADETASTLITDVEWSRLPGLPNGTVSPTEHDSEGNPDYPFETVEVIASLIHLISPGVKVTWDDHNELVYTMGKDRGERPPPPTLPDDYQTKGPLKGFDFRNLRKHKLSKAAVNEFYKKWSNEDQTPTSLVKVIMEQFDSVVAEHMNYIIQRRIEIARMDGTIKDQKQEIEDKEAENKMKDGFISTKNEEIAGYQNVITALSQEVMDYEAETEQRRKDALTLPASPNSMSMSKLFQEASKIRLSLTVSNIRLKLQRAISYIYQKEWTAASKVIVEIEDTMAQKVPKSPSRDLLLGKVYYWKARALLGHEFWPEAAQFFGMAVDLGLKTGCGEVEGDNISDWVAKASDELALFQKELGDYFSGSSA